MTHDKFVEQLEGYLKHIRAAYGYFDAYEAIITAYYNNFEEISRAPGFFTVARCSLYNSMLMELAKLYCTRRQSPERTLSKLLNLLQDNRHLFRAEDDIKGLIEEAKLRLADMEPEISILAKRRDKYMAHNDPMCFEKDFNPGKELFLGEGVILALLTFSENLCTNIFSRLDKRTVCMRMKNSADLSNLLEAIQRNCQ